MYLGWTGEGGGTVEDMPSAWVPGTHVGDQLGFLALGFKWAALDA